VKSGTIFSAQQRGSYGVQQPWCLMDLAALALCSCPQVAKQFAPWGLTTLVTALRFHQIADGFSGGVGGKGNVGYGHGESAFLTFWEDEHK
jgi:hypothetical protein